MAGTLVKRFHNSAQNEARAKELNSIEEVVEFKLRSAIREIAIIRNSRYFSMPDLQCYVAAVSSTSIHAPQLALRMMTSGWHRNVVLRRALLAQNVEALKIIQFAFTS